LPVAATGGGFDQPTHGEQPAPRRLDIAVSTSRRLDVAAEHRRFGGDPRVR
jgi:hypothetical protein